MQPPGGAAAESTAIDAMERQAVGYETCMPVKKEAHLQPGQGPLCADAGLAPQYAVGGEKLPFCHERPDREDGQRPAGLPEAVLDMVGRNYGGHFRGGGPCGRRGGGIVRRWDA